MADLLDLVLLAGVHEPDASGPARTVPSLTRTEQDHAAVGVVLGVEDQGAQRVVRIALRRRQLCDDRLQHVVDADALLGRAEHGLEGVEPEVGVDLLAHPLDVGRGEVDLVDDRHDLEVVLEGEVEVGDGLRLDALGGVDEQQRPLAGHQRAAHLVGEVDVAGGVDQVELVVLAVLGRRRGG